MSPADLTDTWPALPLAEWKDTYRTLHRWTQMVGKVQLALTPRTNHFWNVTLHPSARGLTTMAIPVGTGACTMAFDFVDHVLRIDVGRGDRRLIPLAPQPIAQFYERFVATLRALGIQARIWPMPVEVPDPIRFDRDPSGAYDPDSARRCWRILFEAGAVMNEFRARFIGKCSPVHFFWGSFDLAVTRFSGRLAPPRPGADAINREAYSHEVISAGWWPGGSGVNGPAFYCYAAPEPAGLPQQKVQPESGFYHPDLKEFILMYDEIRKSRAPEPMLLEFLQSTYEAAAALAHWDRGELEIRQSAA